MGVSSVPAGVMIPTRGTFGGGCWAETGSAHAIRIPTNGSYTHSITSLARIRTEVGAASEVTELARRRLRSR